MNKYWFAPKQYGYGYVPISVEGFIATLIVIGIGIFLAEVNNFFNSAEITFQDSLFFVLEILIVGFIFLKIFERKCKGKLKWHWGNK